MEETIKMSSMILSKSVSPDQIIPDVKPYYDLGLWTGYRLDSMVVWSGDYYYQFGAEVIDERIRFYPKDTERRYNILLTLVETPFKSAT